MASSNQDTQNWKDFLKPLNVSRNELNQTGHQDHLRCWFKDDDYTKESMCSHNPVIEKTISNLQRESDNHADVKEHDLLQKRKEIFPSLRLRIDDPFDEELYHFFGVLQNFFEQYEKIDSRKPDSEQSGSSWTLNMLAKYFQLDLDEEYYERPNRNPAIPSKPSEFWCNDCMRKSCKEIEDTLKVLGIPTPVIDDEGRKTTGLRDLQQYCLSKSSIRMVIDVLLRQVCSEADIKIIVRPEHKLIRDGLPVNIFDYALITPDKRQRQCVGIIEVKKPSKMNMNAVPQFILQLLSLMTTTDDPKQTSFGVLTDGYRFLFAYANKYGVFFESECENPTVLVHKAEWCEEVHLIKNKILGLCNVGHDVEFKTQDPSIPNVFKRAFPY